MIAAETVRGAQCASVVDYLLLKLASRCNLNCTYCYWFRDPEVYSKSSVISRETLTVLAQRLRDHIALYGLKQFSILFHGGEPLLAKREDVDFFCCELKSIEAQTGCLFTLNVTTNGLLIDSDWIGLFLKHSIGVTLSIDGPRSIHDRSRIDHKGRGTFDRTVAAIRRLREAGIEPGVLSVCNPSSDPRDVFSLIVDELSFDGFDVLVPDATREDNPQPIARFYKSLFDLWIDEYQQKGVTIRLIDNMLLGLFGGFSRSESIGYGPIRRLTILADGSMETLDVLRIIEPGFTATSLNVHSHPIQAIETDPLWREVLNASVNLSQTCSRCVYNLACGGGHIATRWDRSNRFDNPSVYCEDIKEILAHIWSRVAPSLELVPRQSRIEHA